MAIGRTNAMVVSTTPSTTDPYKGQRPSNWLAVKLPSQMKKEKPNNFQCEILVELIEGGYNTIWLAYVGEFKIDWGDGTLETVSSLDYNIGVLKEVSHTYNYSTITTLLSNNSKQVIIKVINTSFNIQQSAPMPVFSLDGYKNHSPLSSSPEFSDSDNINEYYSTPFLEVSIYAPKPQGEEKPVRPEINMKNGAYNKGDFRLAYFKKLKFISLEKFEGDDFWSLFGSYWINLVNLYSLILFPELVNFQIKPSYVDNVTPGYWELTDVFTNLHSFSSNLDNLFVTDHMNEIKIMTYAFADSQALSELPSQLSFNETTSIFHAFDGCIGISDFHLNTFTNKLENMDYGFRKSGIQVFDGVDTSNVTTMISVFENCSSLQKLTLNLNSITKEENIKDFVKGCGSLTSLTLTKSSGIDVALDLSDCTLLSANYLEALFNNLATITTTKTLTLGTTLLAKLSDTQKAIATNKGWTLA